MDRPLVDYKVTPEKFPLRVQKEIPSAEFPFKQNEQASDATYVLTLISREDKQNDDVHDTTVFDVGLQFGCPPGFCLKIYASPELVKAGYTLFPGCVVINPEDRERLRVHLFKFRESTDIELPFPGLVMTVEKIWYMNIMPVHDMSTSNAYGNLASSKADVLLKKGKGKEENRDREEIVLTPSKPNQRRSPFS